MAIRLLVISFVFFQTHFSKAQIHWEWVPSAPTFTPVDTDKITDITFVDDTVGYLITNTAKVYRTQNGGDNWDSVSILRYAPYITNYSQIEFINRDTGFAMMPYDTILYQTTDGGNSWQQIKLANQGPKPSVISLSKFGQTLFCFFGRNAQELILAIDVVSGYSEIDTANGFSSGFGFVACNQSNGIVFGDSSSRGKILHTSDIGESWLPALTMPISFRAYDINMIDSSIGYALCGKSNSVRYFFIKTTDGGRTWQSIPGTDTITVGLGATMFFATENIGWTGYPTAGLLETTDGGATWHFIYEGQSIYCFTKTPSGVVYAAGKNVIRIDSRLINSLEQISPQQKDGKQFSVFPNPAYNYFSVAQSGTSSTQPVLIKLFDVLGNKLLEQKTYLNERIFVSGLASGVYKIQISTAEASEFHTLIITQHN